MDKTIQAKKYLILLHGLFESSGNCLQALKNYLQALCITYNIQIVSPSMLSKAQLKGPKYTVEFILPELQQIFEKDTPLELILVGHSYGSIVMVDLAKYLHIHYRIEKTFFISVSGCLGGIDLVHLLQRKSDYTKLLAIKNRWNNYKYTDWFCSKSWRKWWINDQKFDYMNSLSFLLPIHLLNFKNGYIINIILSFLKNLYINSLKIDSEVDLIMEDLKPQSKYLNNLHQWMNEAQIPILYIDSNIEKEYLGNTKYSLYNVKKAYYTMLYNASKLDWEKYSAIQEFTVANDLVKKIFKTKENFYLFFKFLNDIAIYDERSYYKWITAKKLGVDAQHDGVLSVRTQRGGYKIKNGNHPFRKFQSFEGLYHNSPGGSVFIPNFPSKPEKISIKNPQVHLSILQAIQKFVSYDK